MAWTVEDNAAPAGGGRWVVDDTPSDVRVPTGTLTPAAAAAGPSEADIAGQIRLSARGFQQEIAQGVTLGAADELAGLAGPPGTADALRAERASYHAQAAAAPGFIAREAPTVANLAGSMVPSIVGGEAAGAALAATRIGPRLEALYNSLPVAQRALFRVARGATVGGTVGAVTGALNAPPGERAQGAAVAGTVSAAVGAAADPVIGLVAWGAGKLGKTALARKVGALFRDDPTQAVDWIVRELQRDNTNVGALREGLDRMGPGGILAEAGGENLQALFDHVMQMPGPARQAAMTILQQRMVQAKGLMVDSFARGLADPTLDVDGATQAIFGRMRQIGQAYDPVLDTTFVPNDPRLATLMDNPVMQVALRRGIAQAETDASIAASQGRNITTMRPNLGVRPVNSTIVDPTTNQPIQRLELFTESETPSLRVMDYVKRGLDEIIDNRQANGKLTGAGAQAFRLKDALRDVLTAVNPRYGQILDQYAAQGSLERALNMGQQFEGMLPEEITRALRGMSANEREMFRMGAMRTVRDRVAQSESPVAVFKANFGQLTREGPTDAAKPSADKILAAMNGDQNAFNEIRSSMWQYARKQQTMNSVHGSPTFKRTAKGEDTKFDPRVVLYGATGNAPGVAASAVRLLNDNASEIPEAVRTEIGRILTMPEGQARDAALATIGRRLAAMQQPPQASLTPVIPRGLSVFSQQVGAAQQ